MKKIFLILLCPFSCFLWGVHPAAGALALVAIPATPTDEAFEEVAAWLEHSAVCHLLLSTSHFGAGTPHEQGERTARLAAPAALRLGGMPLIAADQEGGRVQRVPGTAVPPPMEMDEALIVSYATTLAKETRAAGVNLCLGPVLDLPIEGCFIGNRAFAFEPAAAIRRASLWVATLRSHGLLTVGKHFPGHGASAADTHTGGASVYKDADALRHWDLQPFFALLPLLDGVMSAHVRYPAFDDDEIATYSHAIMTDLLAGYEGMRISDSLSMLAATPVQGDFEQSAAAVAANALRAVAAGCDLVIIGAPEFGAFRPGGEEHRAWIDRVLVLMGEGLDAGAVPAARLEDALRRTAAARER